MAESKCVRLIIVSVYEDGTSVTRDIPAPEGLVWSTEEIPADCVFDPRDDFAIRLPRRVKFCMQGEYKQYRKPGDETMMRIVPVPDAYWPDWAGRQI